jgi:hypothetical protein
MTSYNGGRYVREAIDGILSRAFRDFEFIIVGDCFGDGTVEIIETYREHGDNTSRLQNQSMSRHGRGFQRNVHREFPGPELTSADGWRSWQLATRGKPAGDGNELGSVGDPLARLPRAFLPTLDRDPE